MKRVKQRHMKSDVVKANIQESPLRVRIRMPMLSTRPAYSSVLCSVLEAKGRRCVSKETTFGDVFRWDENA